MALAYCTTCSWRERDDGDDSTTDLDRAMLDHFAATGHAVERADAGEVLDRLAVPRPTAGVLERK